MSPKHWNMLNLEFAARHAISRLYYYVCVRLFRSRGFGVSRGVITPNVPHSFRFTKLRCSLNFTHSLTVPSPLDILLSFFWILIISSSAVIAMFSYSVNFSHKFNTKLLLCPSLESLTDLTKSTKNLLLLLALGAYLFLTVAPLRQPAKITFKAGALRVFWRFVFNYSQDKNKFIIFFNFDK